MAIMAKKQHDFKLSPYVYFVENKVSRGWLVTLDGYDNETYDPSKAMFFHSIEKCDQFIKDNGLSDYYFSTEHEFVP